MEQRIGNRRLPVAVLFAACILGLFACLMATAQPAQAATARNITVVSKHAEAGKATAYTKAVKGYDITGDKKKDKLTVKIAYTNGGNKTFLKIYVNGKKAKTLSYATGSFSQVRVKYLRTSSKKPFLYISLIGVSMNGIYGVYHYKSSKLVKLVKPTSAISPKYGYMSILGWAKASGERISVRFMSLTKTLGRADYTYAYHYKSGKLVRTSATASDLTPVEGTSFKNQPLAFTTKIYKAAGSGKVAYTAKAGTKLTISKVKTLKGRPWFYVKNAKGQTGWIKGLGKFVSEMYENARYNTLFKNLH